jgi:hypothetical protein
MTHTKAGVDKCAAMLGRPGGRNRCEMPSATTRGPGSLGNGILPRCLWLLLILAPAVYGQTDLRYQERGNRFEGIKAAPVSGRDISLVSVLADHGEPATRLPPHLKVRFFLAKKADVYVTVRELDSPGHFYWLDRVTPSPGRAWAVGFGNEFQWDTASVLQALRPPVSVDELGVLIRIGDPEPSVDERVAPAVLYHSSLPGEITGYLFTVRPCCRASVTCAIFAEGGNAPLSSQAFPRTVGGRPLTFRWDARSAPEGAYKLVVTGGLLDTLDPLTLVVHFHHRPKVE